MKVFLCALALVLSCSTFASAGNSLETKMKNMGFAYKQSIKATQLPEFNQAIDQFILLVEQSKQATFNQKAEKSKQGLDKVIEKAKLAKKLANSEGLAAAKKPLKSIDNLRKHYHELHEPPGFFDMLFGN